MEEQRARCGVDGGGGGGANFAAAVLVNALQEKSATKCSIISMHVEVCGDTWVHVPARSWWLAACVSSRYLVCDFGETDRRGLRGLQIATTTTQRQQWLHWMFYYQAHLRVVSVCRYLFSWREAANYEQTGTVGYVLS